MRPVLLIGNGINLSFSDTNIRIDQLLNSKKNKFRKHINIPNETQIPFPLKMVIGTQDHVDDLMKEYTDCLWGKVKRKSEQYYFYEKLLNLPVADILSTNYGFEFEETAYDEEEISKSKIGKITTYIPGKDRKKSESSLFLYTYQSAGERYDNKRIWHIHGHAKNHSSMIIGHCYYGRFLHRIIDYTKQNEGRYRWGKQDPPEIRSWVDAFLFGDIYVLGFSYDFAEMDLWWLLNQKKNGNYGRNSGKLYFYEPYDSSNTAKYELLKSYNSEVRHLNMVIQQCRKEPQYSQVKEENIRLYKEFYYRAVDDIAQSIKDKEKC